MLAKVRVNPRRDGRTLSNQVRPSVGIGVLDSDKSYSSQEKSPLGFVRNGENDVCTR